MNIKLLEANWKLLVGIFSRRVSVRPIFYSFKLVKWKKYNSCAQKDTSLEIISHMGILYLRKCLPPVWKVKYKLSDKINTIWLSNGSIDIFHYNYCVAIQLSQ